MQEYYNSSNHKKAWKISIGIHATVLLCLLTWMLADWILEQLNDPPLVFELVNTPSGDTPIAENTSKQIEKFQKADPKPLLQQDLPEFEKVEPLKLPEEKPIEQPKKEIPKPKPKVVSYKDFTKTNPIKEPTQTVRKPKPKTVEIPDLNPQEIVQSLQDSLADSDSINRMNSMSQAQQAQLLRYYDLIRQAINTHFREPSGTFTKSVTTVWIMVDAKGNIRNPRIVKSSGNNLLDNAALETFNRIKKVSPPPGGKSLSFTLRFNIN